MSSDKPTGADNQQGSRNHPPLDDFLTPQRLHAELLGTGAKGLEALWHPRKRQLLYNRMKI